MGSTAGGQSRAGSNRRPFGDIPQGAASGQRTLPTRPNRRPYPVIQDDGITELWCPSDPSQILADVYFVHGLMGHPFKTWYHSKPSQAKRTTEPTSNKSRRKGIFSWGRHADKENIEEVSGASTQDDQGCYWPLDLIPDDFDNVRVFTCGYNSYPTRGLAGANEMNISQHARNLLHRIKNTRADCPGRPIIFVAHSLGGILVKDAIIESAKHKHQPPLKDISESCFAIFFFGTPHRGSDAAKYGARIGMVLEVCGLEVNQTVLRALRPDGEKLSAVELDFNDLLNEPIPPTEKIQVCSYREGRSLTGLKHFPVGKVMLNRTTPALSKTVPRSLTITPHPFLAGISSKSTSLMTTIWTWRASGRTKCRATSISKPL